MPLKARGRVLGVLALIRTTEQFDANDVETVRELAARAAVAVDNAYLYRAAERGRERLGLLAEASELLASTLEVEPALVRLGELVARRFAESCAIYLLERPGELRLVAGEPDPRIGPGGVASDAAMEALAGTGPMLFSGPPTALGKEGAQAGLVVPLVARGAPLGLLALGASQRRESYSPAEIDLAVDLARRSANAIDTARLYHEAEERAQAARVLASVGDGVFLVDRQGVVRTWNHAAAAATGLPADQVIGRPAAEAIPGWADVADRVPLAAPGSGAPRAESLPLDLGPHELWLSVHGVVVPDGVVFAFRDLTEERALEAMRTEFVSTVSHELRTPLAAIYGAAMTLRRGDVTLDDDQRARLLDVVSGEADRLARTVNDILWASRLDAGSLHVSIQSCDPLALTELRRRGPACASRRRVRPDPERRRRPAPGRRRPRQGRACADQPRRQRGQVLALTAAGSTSASAGSVRTCVSSSPTRASACRSPSSGGSSRSSTGSIPNMTRGVGGTGLGLYICRELLRRMDGRIWVDSPGSAPAAPSRSSCPSPSRRDERSGAGGLGRPAPRRCDLRASAAGLVAGRRRVVDDGRAAARPCADAAPRRPEHERQDESDHADDHQDDTDGVDVQPRHGGVDRPREDGPGCDQDQTDSDTHRSSFGFSRRGRAPDRAGYNGAGDFSVTARTVLTFD